MSACNFKIPFTGVPDSVLQKAKKSVEGQGGSFSGDMERGVFDLSVFGNTIKGSYSVSGQILDIIIEEKPFLVPCLGDRGFSNEATLIIALIF